ncbi:MAG: metal ABC transporter ATP-binding protein [Treponema sp.]|nr:metal ABC transporter ATP-binding protein [Treponema sp.]
MALVECENVCVNYGNYEACKNVSFSINPGDYLCIVGSNGSGKSTLVKAILGLVPVKSGKITLDKVHTGYLPQQNNIQRDFPACVREVVLSGCLSRGQLFYSREDKKNAEEQIKNLQLEAIAGKSFSELSGGQQQRVLLARALCAAKNLIVLDEPVTGLDPLVTDELYGIIRKLNKERKIAVIMVSHDVHRAVQNASHILNMNKEAIFFGTSQEYQKTEFYKNLSHVEVCETHLCNHCGNDCNATHIHLPGDYSHA